MSSITYHYQMTRWLREQHREHNRIAKCVACGRIRDWNGDWADYGPLPRCIRENDITGTYCTDFMRRYFESKR